MNKKDKKKYKTKLLNLKEKILNGHILKSKEEFQIQSEEFFEEGDMAEALVNQEFSVSMKQREIRKLKAIDQALKRIESGEYGLCEDCDELISAKRLENQPWTSLCITHAEQREKHQLRLSI